MDQRIVVFSVTLALLTVCCLVTATAQITETKLLASDGGYLDLFGWSVSTSGDHVIVGALSDDDNGDGAGAAYIFHYDGLNWMEQSKLIASNGAERDNFGYSVSLSGDYAIVGAPYNDDNGSNAGAAYIFHNDGTNWTEQARLVGSDASKSYEFGSSVSISGDYAFVGACGYNGYSAGSVYVFHYDESGWVEQTKLTASDGDDYDFFGRSVSLSGDHAIVGAYSDSDIGSNAGSAYIFQHDGSSWVEHAKLIANDGEANDFFGRSVSLSGNYALVGADGVDIDGTESAGSAYVFHLEGSSWVEQTRLTGDPTGGYFGYSVSLSGDYALVGAYGDRTGSGSAYIFHHDGSSWIEQTQLIASDVAPLDVFGRSVSISGKHALIGATHNDDLGYGSGSAYVYSASPVCDKVSQFQARCRPGGVIKARVIMADSSHSGKVVGISIDQVPYTVAIDASGRGQLSQGGFGDGPHTVELTDPGQCFDPVIVTCRAGLANEEDDEWLEDEVSELPTETALRGQPVLGLAGNYPNPFNPSTTIRYALSVDSPVSLRVYNMLGQEVATLVDGFQKAGEQSVVWHGVNNFGQPVASGLYVYRLQTGNTVMTQKMLFTK